MIEWTPGIKHPETNVEIFKNVYDYDRVRRILLARCKLCGYVISRDEKAVREISMECGDKFCPCAKSEYASKIHQVRNLCYDMWHALYRNTMLKNMNYFKELDEKDKKRGVDHRKRMGLDDANNA